MAILRCPQCRAATPRRLDDVGDNRAVNYFCCRRCGHLWTTRVGSTDKLHTVTPLTTLRKRARRR